jgi:hypothetical protein
MRPRRDWFAGLVAGAWIGFALVYFAIVGAVLFVGFAVGASIARSLAAVGGLLVGAGGVMLPMLALANWNCAGNFGTDDGACTPPDLTGWLVAGSAMAIIGFGVTVVAIARSRRDAAAALHG